MIENFVFPNDVYKGLVRLMKQNEKIMAIKAVRVQTGLGLKEAKEFVERFSFVVKTPMIKGYADPNLDS